MQYRTQAVAKTELWLSRLKRMVEELVKKGNVNGKGRSMWMGLFRTHRYPILFLAESYETEKWQNNLLAIFHQVM